ncbi:hypothetical protein [Cellulomonas cellasea]|uniref:PGAP1-like protein n=2 Tax=Cellulomonas cellasea TaxID=43670 RepID=A0A4Y3KSE2_9CELL|nr:hypothetical protein [Cellulomonas cellasea]GEA86962.1 hypothetical protein CCE01nite_09110 [Cellulomonas cellasea]
MTVAERGARAPGCAADPAGIRVSGGRGGTAARLEDLRRAALELRAAADLLDDATATLATAERVTWAGADALTAGQHARVALAPLRRGPTTTAATAVRVRDLARALDRTAETYAAAEHGAERLVRGLTAVGATLLAETPLRFLAGHVVVGGLAGGLLLEGAVHRATGRWVGPADLVRSGAAEAMLHGAATFLRALQPGLQLPVRAPVGEAVAPLARHLGTGEVRVRPLLPSLAQRLGVAPAPPPIVVPLVGAGLPTAHAAPRSIGAVLRDVDTGYDGALGTVAVTRLDHPDGTRSWVVAIPGTEDHRLVTSNPLNHPSNLRLMAEQAAASAALVARALAQAGVRPGEPVMLAGHSQGGMAAMQVAADPAVRSRYSITHVLTAGSPIAGMAVPPDVRVLSIEHTTDPVPITDGAPNPDAPHRTTVRVELAQSPDVDDRLAARGVMDAHGSEVYVRSAERIAERASAHPSLQDWDASARAQIYGAGATTATTTEYQGTNVLHRDPEPPADARRRAAPAGASGP